MYAHLSDEDLLAQCVVQTYRSSGSGGQNVNKRDTAVRMRHQPTGLTVTCQRERSQFRNKQIALVGLRKKLEAMMKRPVPRVKTKPKRAAKERTLSEKKQQSEKKDLRRKPSDFD